MTASPRRPTRGCCTSSAARTSPTPPPRRARLLLDLDRAAWSDEACSAFGVDPAELPAVVTCAEPVGTTAVFGTEVPVCGLAVDQQAALFAEHCLAPGEAKCTYGTGAFLLATVGDEPRRSANGLVGCIAWQLLAHPPHPAGGAPRTTYCLDGQVYTVGAAVQWLTDLGLVAAPTDLDALGGSVPGELRRGVRPRPRRPGRAVLAAARARRVHRAVAGHDARGARPRRRRRASRRRSRGLRAPRATTWARRSRACASTAASRARAC